MSLRSKKSNCYCAFCRSPRRVYKKRNIGVLNIIYAAMASSVTMYAFWRGFDPRVLVIFAVFLGLAETFIQIRWRLSVVCKQCGFDPVLYVKDSDRMADQVRVHLEKRRQDPNLLLAKPLNLPAISKDRSEALQHREKKGQLVSREI